MATRWGYKDLFKAQGTDFVMPDLGWAGGISEVKKIATMAEAYELPIAPHDCTGPVVFMASSHLSLNAPNAVFQESVRALYTGWYKEVVNNLPTVEQGMISVSDAPGLGMDLLKDIEKRKDAIVRVSKVNSQLKIMVILKITMIYNDFQNEKQNINAKKIHQHFTKNHHCRCNGRFSFRI